MLLHPLMLAWIGGALVPLILHLFSRSRYRAVPWGAMMFLPGVGFTPNFGTRAKSPILLLIRMGGIGLLAAALTRPVISSEHTAIPTAGLTTGGRTAAVIILDDSASMGYMQNGQSRLDQARQVTLQILASLKRGDQVSLLLAGTTDYQLPAPLTADLQSVAGRVTDLQPGLGQADFAVELNRARDLLDRSPIEENEIYLICDRQALSWRNVTDAFKQRWATHHAGRSIPRITVFPVGTEDADNLAIDAIEIPDHLIIRDLPTTVQVRVRNFGPTSQPAVPLTVWSAARTLGTTTIAVPPHSVRSVNLPVRFSDNNSRVISAALHSTGLTYDDRLDYATDVIDPFQLLMVTGNSEPATTQPITAPTSSISVDGRRGGNLAIATQMNFAEWQKASLKKYDIVVLADVPEISADQTKTLRQFVSEGGGLLILPGVHLNTENYNQIAYADGHGILPAKLRPLINKATHIETVTRQHPIFRFLFGRTDPFSSLPVTSYFPTLLRWPDSRLVARLVTGDPCLIDATIGRGKVLFLNAILEPAAVDFQTGVGQSLLHSTLRYLGTGRIADRNLYPGQPIVAVVDDLVEDRTATVQFTTGSPREPATVLRTPDHTEIRFAKTNKPGTYRLRYRTEGKEKLLNYVVIPTHADSDLTPLTADQWKTLNTRIGLNRVDLSHTTVATAVDVPCGGREIWIDLLAAALIFLTAEMFLSHRWNAQR